MPRTQQTKRRATKGPAPAAKRTAPAEKVAAVAKAPPAKLLFVFDEDFSTEKPALHELYVARACEALEIVDEAIERLSEMSNWPASDFASVLIEKKQEYIKKHAAYRDAAALRSVGLGFTSVD